LAFSARRGLCPQIIPRSERLSRCATCRSDRCARARLRSSLARDFGKAPAAGYPQKIEQESAAVIDAHHGPQNCWDVRFFGLREIPGGNLGAPSLTRWPVASAAGDLPAATARALHVLAQSASGSISGGGRLGFWQASRVSSRARRSNNFMLSPR